MVRITPIYKPWNCHLEGVKNNNPTFLGELLTSMERWDMWFLQPNGWTRKAPLSFQTFQHANSHQTFLRIVFFIHVKYIYPHIWLVFMVNVDKYTIYTIIYMDYLEKSWLDFVRTLAIVGSSCTENSWLDITWCYPLNLWRFGHFGHVWNSFVWTVSGGCIFRWFSQFVFGWTNMDIEKQTQKYL